VRKPLEDPDARFGDDSGKRVNNLRDTFPVVFLVIGLASKGFTELAGIEIKSVVE
jgi:hypothetical protein